MQKYFLENGSDELLIFFCGWWMDERPIKGFEFGCDVLFLYNYSNLVLEYDFSKYKKINLMSHSYGVFISGLVGLPKIDYAIAINGTGVPIDDRLGISERVFNLTLDNMTMESAPKFRRKLFNNESDFEKFNKRLPNRSLECSLKELAFIKGLSGEAGSIKFDKVIISTDDKIFPTRSQREYWSSHKNSREIKAGHFPFYQFKNFQDIMEL